MPPRGVIRLKNADPLQLVSDGRLPAGCVPEGETPHADGSDPAPIKSVSYYQDNDRR